MVALNDCTDFTFTLPTVAQRKQTQHSEAGNIRRLKRMPCVSGGALLSGHLTQASVAAEFGKKKAGS